MAGVMLVSSKGCRGEGGGGKRSKGGDGAEAAEREDNQLSLVALLLAAIRRSMASCRVDQRGAGSDATPSSLEQMDISWPTDVRHVAHVTFDRFHGFLGLPVEFELEVPCRAPSASASVFGVSAESMQCCYDTKGNSVPTILLLMQDKLYSHGGLKAEGIFRINPENSQEELVREQLNKGIVPDDIDVHCLAGLIKAWFRELPEGVLDCLSPEQVLQCNTEEECVSLVKQLLPTQAALLSWGIELMADVVEEEETNKMNARNIAMVFAPNMTQMSDPLTALMHAVQVMNLLKTLILKALREREETAMEGRGYSPFSSSPSSDQERGSDSESQESQQDMDMIGELKENISDNDPNVSSEMRSYISERGSDSSSQQDDMAMYDELRREENVSDDNCDVREENVSDDDPDESVKLKSVDAREERISETRYAYYGCHLEEEYPGKKIEECFLRQLVQKELSGNLGEDCTGQGYFVVEQATRCTGCDSSLGSLLSISEGQRGSMTPSNETCSDLSIRESASKPFEDGQEVEMVGCN